MTFVRFTDPRDLTGRFPLCSLLVNKSSYHSASFVQVRGLTHCIGYFQAALEHASLFCRIALLTRAENTIIFFILLFGRCCGVLHVNLDSEVFFFFFCTICMCSVCKCSRRADAENKRCCKGRVCMKHNANGNLKNIMVFSALANGTRLIGYYNVAR